MGRTPRELLAGHTAIEIAELMAFSDIEPMGEEREDLRAALVGLRLAQVQGSKSAKLKDFLLPLDPPKPKADIGEQLAILAATTAAGLDLNGR
jgi:hypothetical protein